MVKLLLSKYICISFCFCCILVRKDRVVSAAETSAEDDDVVNPDFFLSTNILLVCEVAGAQLLRTHIPSALVG